MNHLQYRVADPTKNITILVTSQARKEDYASLASDLLQTIPDAEQVGFIIKPDHEGSRIGMCMMGGEFCGNATLSTAALAAQEDGLCPGEEDDIQLDVSGADHALVCHIKAQMPTENFNASAGCHTDHFIGSLDMPLPEGFTSYHGNPAVCFPGIVHVIIPAGTETQKAIEKQIRLAADELGAAALGMLLWDENSSYMTPCVYVKDTDSLYWEKGCASGSAAIGAWHAHETKAAVSTKVNQPGGMIQADADYKDGKITKLAITGQVILR